MNSRLLAIILFFFSFAPLVAAEWTFPIENRGDAGFRKLGHPGNQWDTWYGSRYWIGSNWTRVGRDWQHPDEETPSVRTFTAGRDGRATVTGRVYKAHQDPSTDGVRVFLRHNDHVLWEAEIDGADGEGVKHDLTLDLKNGDRLRFIVHKRGKITCDTTYWDPVIAFADGETYRASEDFSPTDQGKRNWSYESLSDGDSLDNAPALAWLARDFVLNQAALREGSTQRLDSNEVLPLFVLTDPITGRATAFVVSGGTWALEVTAEKDRIVVRPLPGSTTPEVESIPFEGSPLSGLLLAGSRLDGVFPWVAIAEGLPGRLPSFGLSVMLQVEWRREDGIVESAESYREAALKHLDRTEKLLEHLQSEYGDDFLAAETELLLAVKARLKQEGSDPAAARRLYARTRLLKRHVVLSNPLLDFDELLFCKRVPTSYSHLVMQYYGWRARPGGSLFVLENPGYSLDCRDLLGGGLREGNILEPRLAFDGTRIVFSYVHIGDNQFDFRKVDNEPETEGGFYHIWEVNADGTGLRQLTRGKHDDLMPTYLPDGGIAFMSTRRKGYARCFGEGFSHRWDVYTLHRMNGDGSDIRILSHHDTNEWFPTVSNTGHILYARWDYIDRDAVTHQNLWASRPDGTNPIAVWGNATPSPHCTFQPQPIPNSNKIVFTASAHHSITAGPITIVDPSINVDGEEALTRVTPEIPFPEAESRDIREYYTAPWPLSEKFFLVGYSPFPLVWEPGANRKDALGIYILDAFGNRELLYRDPEIGSTNPCPLRPRPMPPVLASHLPENAEALGEMTVADVYQGLGPVPRGTIKRLRVVQVFTKTTPFSNRPPIGIAGEENGRAILGEVPVEEDGSARFLVPSGKLVYFHALDEDGFAYQTMRSGTYLQPGEKVSCVGCHEPRMSGPVAAAATPLAMLRPPSRLDPGEWGARPFSYMEMVQPVWEKHCTGCHGANEPDGGIDLSPTPTEHYVKSYESLVNDGPREANQSPGTGPLVPRFEMRNQVQVTPPGGAVGARGSRLIALLRAGHEGVELTPEELRRVGTWIDMNAIFYGVYLPEEQARQRKGEAVGMPEIQ